MSEEDILQIHKGIEEKKDHIYTCEINPETGRKRFCHSFVYANPCILFGRQPKYEFDGF